MATEKNYRWSTVDPNGQPWVRDMEESVTSLRRAVNRLEQSQTNVGKNINAGFSSQPLTMSVSYPTAGIGLYIPDNAVITIPGENGDETITVQSDGFADYNYYRFETPLGRTRASMSVQGIGTFFDTTRSTTASLEGRVVVNNTHKSPHVVAPRTFIQAYDLTAYSFSVGYSFEISDLAPVNVVSLQMRINDANAFVSDPRNVASISATVTFS